MAIKYIITQQIEEFIDEVAIAYETHDQLPKAGDLVSIEEDLSEFANEAWVVVVFEGRHYLVPRFMTLHLVTIEVP